MVIPYGRQTISNSDIKSVVDVLKSDWLTQGSKVGEFEENIAAYCGAKYAVAVSSGTAALHIACLAAGLQKGDEAITTPITFLATSNAVLYAGAKPVFADVEDGTGNIDPRQIIKKFTKKTKVVIPVHLAGLPAKMKEIFTASRKKDLTVIEDACHALGAEYKCGSEWVKVGSCRHSDMTVFSFHPVKHITTGEGGAITTNSRRLYNKLIALRSHGTYKTSAMIKDKGPWYYEMRDLGFNYRITDFQCALGISQFKKLEQFLSKRKKIAYVYDEVFCDTPGVKIPYNDKNNKHAYHLYTLRIEFGKIREGRDVFVNELRKKGIMTQVHYIPVYYHPYYKKLGYKKGICPEAEKFYQEELSIPLFPSIKDREIRRVVSALRGLLR